jgi:hypothetical protein
MRAYSLRFRDIRQRPIELQQPVEVQHLHVMLRPTCNCSQHGSQAPGPR